MGLCHTMHCRERAHSDLRCFLCDKCSFSTNYKTEMDRHARECTMHLKCGQCDFVTSREGHNSMEN